MGTPKPLNAINKILGELKNTEFQHRREMADHIGIHHKTLRKWIEISDYTWEDFNIKPLPKLKNKIEKNGGLEFLKKKFSEGYSYSDIAEELNVNKFTFNSTMHQYLKDKGVTREELGYYGKPAQKTEKMYKIIEGKGGLKYILTCKFEHNMTVSDIIRDIGGDITRDYIMKYLKQYNLTYTNFNSLNNVYYIPHIRKWRGTILLDENEVYDTGLYDTIDEAIDQVEKYKKKNK